MGASEMFHLIDNVQECILDIFTGSIGYSFGAAVHRALNPSYSRCLQNGPGLHNGCWVLCSIVYQYYTEWAWLVHIMGGQMYIQYCTCTTGLHNGGLSCRISLVCSEKIRPPAHCAEFKRPVMPWEYSTTFAALQDSGVLCATYPSTAQNYISQQRYFRLQCTEKTTAATCYSTCKL